MQFEQGERSCIEGKKSIDGAPVSGMVSLRWNARSGESLVEDCGRAKTRDSRYTTHLPVRPLMRVMAVIKDDEKQKPLIYTQPDGRINPENSKWIGSAEKS